MRRWAGDRRIATKIISVSLVVTAIFTASGVVGLLNLRRLVAEQDREYRVNVVALARMTAVRSAVGAQQESVLSYILSEPGFYRDSYATVIAETDEAIDTDVEALTRIGLPAAEHERLRAFAATITVWRTARDDALAAARAGDQRRAASAVLVRSEAIARAVKDRASGFLDQLVDAVAEGARRTRANSVRTAQLTGVLLGVGAITAVLLSVLAARTISRPLREVVDVLARVARGDLSRRVELDRDDEVGQMGRSLNETLGVLRTAFEEVHHRASHDGLTGLANRALLRERLAAARGNALAGLPVAILLVDLDGFKQVNDAHGHVAGDHLLTVVAERLLAGVRPCDTVARLGGDEFAVLLDGMDSREAVDAVADRLLTALQVPTGHHGATITPQASIGVSLWDGDAPIDALMHDADVAMYAAKTGGKGRVAHAHPNAPTGARTP
ncbi:diguanylate cyclase [Dactylosporangium aurantiacum]|uniref:Diguanylate cyclase n=1 Tax=Dactylosporangium aurantiacum TaxID=35754 RepID=A0A9Q9IA02_9ACTN|nr:diguanylate cyclase [Dactylosporangium aurantiacum]MDG6108875.1 diguanylate cyclase [Dactylosporangium aurantiacum]UWZ52172.1 diguanylate cyclase [Dactylosporangium aurantiacum]